MDLSTMGVKMGWACETTAGTKPTAFKWLKRCNKIGGLGVTNDKIDVTCFEDAIKQYIKGVGDTGGDWPINFNGSSAFADDYDDLLTAYETAKAENKRTWIDVFIPGFGSYFVVAEPGELPLPDLEPSSKLDIQTNWTINEYVGLEDAIEPTATVS